MVAHGGDLAVKEGGVDELAFAGFIAVVEGGYDGAVGQHPGEEVNQGEADALGRAIGFAGEVHEAAVSLDDEVVAGLVGHGAGAPVAGDGAIDDVRVDFLDVVVAEAHAGQGAGAEALDHHVGVSGEFFDDVQALFGLEIDGEAALVAVEGEELRAFAVPDGGPLAGFVAVVGFFDFDDVGAHVGEVLSAKGAGQGAGKVNDLDVVQRLRHRFSPHFFRFGGL